MGSCNDTIGKTLVQRLREGGCGRYCDDLEREAAAEIERMRADLAAYFALADASWRETCETAKTAGITSIPIGPAHAAALDKFNDLRALYGPNVRANRPASGPQE